MPTTTIQAPDQESSEPVTATQGPIRQVLRIHLRSLECALDLDLVERILPLVELQQVPGGPDHLVGLMDYGGESVAVVDLGIWLGLSDVEPYTLDTPIVLCGDGRCRVGFVVSSVTKVEEVPASAVQMQADFEESALSVSAALHLESGLAVLFDIQRILRINYVMASSALSIETRCAPTR